MGVALASINLAVGASGLAICAIGLIAAASNHLFDRTTKRYLVALFSVLVASMVTNLAYQFIDAYSSGAMVFALQLFLFLHSTFLSIAMPMLTSFFLYSCGERDWKHSAIFRVAGLLWIVYFCLLSSTWFTDVIYTHGDDGEYRRGPFYSLLLVPTILIMVLNLVALWHKRSNLSSHQLFAFAAYTLVPAVSMVVQMLFFGLYAIVLGTAIGAFILLMFIQQDTTRIYLLREVELTRLKSDIMLSQLQPHFLGNALGAIGHLCQNDAKAKEAINAFSRYLRDNVDSLTQTAPVPFRRELEHTKTYLELEQLRFGDDLHAAFDIGCTEFFLPTLTLQPIVENAVRHGIRKTEDGAGTVTVLSRELEDRWEVVVADDGAGFDPCQPLDDGRSHIGLSGVRERLRIMCGGDLRVESSPGHGSQVTIVVPKNE